MMMPRECFCISTCVRRFSCYDNESGDSKRSRIILSPELFHSHDPNYLVGSLPDWTGEGSYQRRLENYNFVGKDVPEGGDSKRRRFIWYFDPSTGRKQDPDGLHSIVPRQRSGAMADGQFVMATEDTVDSGSAEDTFVVIRPRLALAKRPHPGESAL
jgi:hypothetical protein